LVIPATVVVSSIGSEAFYGCESLTINNISKLTVGADYTKRTSDIGVTIFKTDDVTAYDSGCLYIGDISNLDVPVQSASSVVNGAFRGCASLTKVSFSSTSITSSPIGNDAFVDCVNLINVTFKNVSSATFVSSENNVGSGAFKNCTDLQNIVFPAVTNTS
jgi:hypothetical protein